MAKKHKSSVVLIQYLDPKATPDSKDQYVYRVHSAKNRLEPAVGSYLTPSGVRDLIQGGVDVTIKQP